MGIIKDAEIVGYHLEDGVYCVDCIGEIDNDLLTEDTIITEDDLDHQYADDVIFCDKCHKQISH
jgi:hypothetical protein